MVHSVNNPWLLHFICTLNSPIILGQNKFVDPTLILIMRINVQPTLNFEEKVSAGHITCLICRKLMWVILSCASYVLYLAFNVLDESVDKDLGEGTGSWTHINLTLTTKISVAHANFPPTLIGLFRVTSHMRVKFHDHCILRSLIGQKGRDRPSSLHTRRKKPRDPKKLSWMRSLRRFLHDKLYILFHNMQEFA